MKALRAVCNDLGFKELSSPAFQKEGDYYSVVEQRFDTRTQGQISFKLSLDDVIQSESNIHVENCRNEFAELSKLLVKKYGVETELMTQSLFPKLMRSRVRQATMSEKVKQTLISQKTYFSGRTFVKNEWKSNFCSKRT